MLMFLRPSSTFVFVNVFTSESNKGRYFRNLMVLSVSLSKICVTQPLLYSAWSSSLHWLQEDFTLEPASLSNGQGHHMYPIFRSFALLIIQSHLMHSNANTFTNYKRLRHAQDEIENGITS